MAALSPMLVTAPDPLPEPDGMIADMRPATARRLVGAQCVGAHQSSWTPNALRPGGCHGSRVELTNDISAKGHENALRIVLPLEGMLSYRAGGAETLCDPNAVLLVRPGHSYQYEHYGARAGCLVVTPARSLAREVERALSAARSVSPPADARPASAALRVAGHRLAHLLTRAEVIPSLEECAWYIVQCTLELPTPRRSSRARLVGQAKQLLHSCVSDKVSLNDIASQLGVTGIYLTQEFTRQEGMPLYRYHLRLRLTQALRDLPTACDITALALDLGFSSHSHFTCMFRKEFGMTPSDYRRGACLEPFVVRDGIGSLSQF